MGLSSGLFWSSQGPAERTPDQRHRVQGDASSAEGALRLLGVREAALVAQLQRVMQENAGAVFDTWMKRQSELVQATAEAFIENYVATVAQEDLAKASGALSGVLGAVLRLDALSRVQANLGWYLLEGHMSSSEARQVRARCTSWRWLAVAANALAL
jgi:Acyl-CoA oxidase